jgi:hypothetical protein
MTTIKVLLSVAINQGWSLYKMDVSNAFLHGDLCHNPIFDPFILIILFTEKDIKNDDEKNNDNEKKVK